MVIYELVCGKPFFANIPESGVEATNVANIWFKNYFDLVKSDCFGCRQPCVVLTSSWNNRSGTIIGLG